MGSMTLGNAELLAVNAIVLGILKIESWMQW